MLCWQMFFFQQHLALTLNWILYFCIQTVDPFVFANHNTKQKFGQRNNTDQTGGSGGVGPKMYEIRLMPGT